MKSLTWKSPPAPMPVLSFTSFLVYRCEGRLDLLLSVPLADSIMKQTPIEITFIETPATLTYNNQVTVTFTGDYAAVMKAANIVYDKWSQLAATLGSVPSSIYVFGQ